MSTAFRYGKKSMKGKLTSQVHDRTVTQTKTRAENGLDCGSNVGQPQQSNFSESPKKLEIVGAFRPFEH